ncbi:MAG TPA: hypothetical protein VGR82_04445 [Methylomirabilota bacterium]|jgi:hypothetical protein|nr:hypothetical protein [Methylomirabilota bacterium]
MKKVVAILLLGLTLIAVSPIPAHAGGRGLAEAAFALGAFAVLSPLLIGAALARPWYEPVYVAPPPVVYAAPAPVVYTQPAPVYASQSVTYAAPPTYAGPPPPPKVQREVVYPHGRYQLYGDGVRMPYQWVWVANPPPPPAPPSQ